MSVKSSCSWLNSIQLVWVKTHMWETRVGKLSWVKTRVGKTRMGKTWVGKNSRGRKLAWGKPHVGKTLRGENLREHCVNSVWAMIVQWLYMIVHPHSVSEARQDLLAALSPSSLSRGSYPLWSPRTAPAAASSPSFSTAQQQHSTQEGLGTHPLPLATALNFVPFILIFGYTCLSFFNSKYMGCDAVFSACFQSLLMSLRCYGNNDDFSP